MKESEQETPVEDSALQFPAAAVVTAAIVRTLLQAASSRIQNTSLANTDEEVLGCFWGMPEAVREYLMGEAMEAADAKREMLATQHQTQMDAITDIVEQLTRIYTTNAYRMPLE